MEEEGVGCKTWDGRGAARYLLGKTWLLYTRIHSSTRPNQSCSSLDQGSRGRISAEGLLVEKQEVCYDIVPSSYDREATSVKPQQHGCLNTV